MTDETTIPQTATVADFPGGWSLGFGFSQFDPSLGALDSIEVGLAGDVRGVAAIENLGASAASVDIVVPGTVSVAAPDGTALAVVNPVATQTLNLGAYDGTADFAGASGTVAADFSNAASIMSEYVPGGTIAEPFVGTGQVDLTTSGNVASGLAGNGNLLSVTAGEVGANVSLGYSYAPADTGPGSGNASSDTQLTEATYDDEIPFTAIGNYQTTAVQTIRVADATTDWNSVVMANQFDPTLGTLEDVHLTLISDVNGGLAVENLGSTPGMVSLTDTALLTVQLPNGDEVIARSATIVSSTSLAAFDGTIDFGGVSGSDLGDLTNTITTQTSLDNAGLLSAFVGTGTTALSVSAYSPSILSGPAVMAAELLTEAGATVKISYVYLPGTTVAAAAVGIAPIISGTEAGQGVTDQTTVAPFANVMITDPNVAQTETVTVMQSAAANGTLSNLVGGQYDPTTGVYTDTGSADAVTAALRGLIFTPATIVPGQTITTGFTISDSDTALASATDQTTSVNATRGVYIDTAAVASEVRSEVDGPTFSGDLASNFVFSENTTGAITGDWLPPARLVNISTGSATLAVEATSTLTAGALITMDPVGGSGIYASEPIVNTGTLSLTGTLATGLLLDNQALQLILPVTVPPLPVAAEAEFDAAWYLLRNPDVAASGMDPLAHYENFGWKEGRDPDPFFNTNYYLKQNPDVAAAGVDPLLHYEAEGWKEGRDPSIAFSTDAYLAANPDVTAANIDPLAHYLEDGRPEGRMAFIAQPHATGPANPLVNASYYFGQNADVAAAGVDPTWHYDTSGWQEGRNPDALFDTAYYLRQNPDVAAAGVNPLLHYEASGWKEGRDPSADFSTAKYLAANSDVAAAGIDPLVQYEQYGINEGRAIYHV